MDEKIRNEPSKYERRYSPDQSDDSQDEPFETVQIEEEAVSEAYKNAKIDDRLYITFDWNEEEDKSDFPKSDRDEPCS
ncbi:MAG: hypothetical protein AAFZ35_09795 [Cyanobacteria bacterium J06649_12]